MRKFFITLLFVTYCFGFTEAQEKQILEPIEIIPVNISGSCSMFVIGWVGEVFETEASLKKAIEGGKLNCEKETMPKIDFQKHTLIGVGATVGNCPAGQKFDLTVEKDVANKIYLVKTKIGSNPCRGLSYMARWVLVSKLPKDYKVEFVKETGEEEIPDFK